MTERALSDDAFCVVLVTASNHEEAQHLARALVESRLAACVQLSPINSVYRWEGEVQQAEEVLMLIKTSRAHFASMERLITALHSYSVPEIIQLPIERGAENYLQWLASELLDKESLT